jgi:hypothetical protein
MLRFAALGSISFAFAACGVVGPAITKTEAYETNGVAIVEYDWEWLIEWDVGVSVDRGFWLGRKRIFSSKPYDVHACAKDGVLTIYSLAPYYLHMDERLQLADRTLEIRFQKTDVPVVKCEPDGSPVYGQT